MRGAGATLGERIKRARVARGLTQGAVAEPDMTGSYLSLIESGQRVPSEKALRHIAARLEVTPDELVTGNPAGLEAKLELELQEARRRAYKGELEMPRQELARIAAEGARYGLARLRGHALASLASLAERTGDLAMAAARFDEALDALRDEPLHLRFEAVVGQARCTHAAGDTRRAIHLVETYLLELRRHGMEDPTATMRALSALTDFYRTLGLRSRAFETARDALKLASEVEDPEQLACMNMNVAGALLNEGRHADALDALKRAELIYQGLDWPLPALRTKINRGIVEAEKGGLDTARRSFQEALELLGDFARDRAVRAEVLNELGRVERLLGNNEGGAALLRDARKLLSSGNLRERGFNAREMGLSLVSSQPAAAEGEFRRAADHYRVGGACREEARTLLELGRLLVSQGRHEAAAQAFEEGLMAAERADDVPSPAAAPTTLGAD